MEEILSWGWQGAKINIEHCDAATTTKSFEKGFLPISDEIKMLLDLQDLYNVGMTINWARSTIEGRSEEKSIEHIKLALHNNVLFGLIFSGVSDNDTQYGSWEDTHMLLACSFDVEFYEESSLLT